MFLAQHCFPTDHPKHLVVCSAKTIRTSYESTKGENEWLFIEDKEMKAKKETLKTSYVPETKFEKYDIIDELEGIEHSHVQPKNAGTA